MSLKTYPLSIRDVKPHPMAYRITGERPDGMPDGYHTGGAYLWEGMVYKPLDGRPYANADCHVQTQEDKILDVMQDVPLFQKNWHVEELNGRRFLVRKQAIIVGSKDYAWTDLDRDQVLQVEQSLRMLNYRNIEINDPISMGFDENGDMFIVDLSCAGYTNPGFLNGADDTNHVLNFFKLCRYNGLFNLRRKARNASEAFILSHDKDYRHVYASFNRPISGLWASIPGAVYVHNERADWDNGIPHSWVVTDKPLSDDVIYRYELSWGWSPVAHGEWKGQIE